APVIGSVAFLGLLSTGIAYVLYFRLIGDAGATTASAVNYVVPIFAVLTSALLLGEPVTWNLVAGGLVVLAGMAYAENRLKRRAPDCVPT
ncbi:MAG TPA: DMT family transporter, partial [Micromonosporaceae bacterium]